MTGTVHRPVELTDVLFPGFDGGPGEWISTLVHPNGVLVKDADGTWRLAADKRVVIQRDSLVDVVRSAG